VDRGAAGRVRACAAVRAEDRSKTKWRPHWGTLAPARRARGCVS
jgi:hypothetical protein